MEALVIWVIGMASAIFVLWPLMRGRVGPKEVPVFSPDGGLENLLREKEAAIGALKEIEFDYLSGKLSHEDYSRLNSGYENRVVRLLKELDEYEAEDPLWQSVEEEIKAARKRDTEIGKRCLRCGCPLPVGSNYCPACGASIDRKGMDGGE